LYNIVAAALALRRRNKQITLREGSRPSAAGKAGGRGEPRLPPHNSEKNQLLLHGGTHAACGPAVSGRHFPAVGM